MHKQVTERLPGIYEINLFQDKNEIRLFLIPGKKGQRSLLIDTGYRTEENQNILTQVLSELNIKFQDLDIFLTHKHHDHTGLASYCAEQGASIYMNPLEDRHLYDCLYYSQGAKSVEEQKKVLHRVGVTEERTPVVWNCYKEFNSYYQNVGKDECYRTVAFTYIPVTHGQIFTYGDYTFQAISIPGHTLGQLGLYDEAHKLIFSGDHIITHIVSIVGTSYLNEHLLGQYFRSLDMFKSQYNDCMIFPAHGDAITNVEAVVEKNISAYRKKLLDIQQILSNSAHALTVQEVAFRTYGVYNIPTDAENFFKIKSIITKTFSCLEYLYDQNNCIRMEQDGMVFYR